PQITHPPSAARAEARPILRGGHHPIPAAPPAATPRGAATPAPPLFVLWLDAHPDFHTLDTTTSGNLHGVPLAYASGQPGFEGYFPRLAAQVEPARICALGIRSVDLAERDALRRAGVTVHDMRSIDEHGIAQLLRAFLERVSAANGMLHVSLDVDFLDPSIAPAVGTTVPGGATFREAHLAMEMLHDSGLVTSLDLVELNPFLDERGRTATLLVDLTASLMGRRIMDRPTRGF
ncbi:arginase family protein, partial [Mesorhizobium sp. M0698]|uniref:arginase family protein n=1 Tax=Mesorhizobium sp. M0698 TaxID=2956987 RepID=UPI003335CAE8